MTGNFTIQPVRSHNLPKKDITKESCPRQNGSFRRLEGFEELRLMGASQGFVMRLATYDIFPYISMLIHEAEIGSRAYCISRHKMMLAGCRM